MSTWLETVVGNMEHVLGHQMDLDLNLDLSLTSYVISGRILDCPET